MRTRDLLGMGLSELWRHKLRTSLTLLGVIIGISTLTSSVAVGLGVRSIIDISFKKKELREITVYGSGRTPIKSPLDGVPKEVIELKEEIPQDRKERIQQRLAEEYRQAVVTPVTKPLSKAQMEEFSSWEHVAEVTPTLQENGTILLNNKANFASLASTRGIAEKLATAIDFGRMPQGDSKTEIILHEYLLFRAGVFTDAQIKALLGQEVIIEFRGNETRSPTPIISILGGDSSQAMLNDYQTLESVVKQLPGAIDKMDFTDAEKARLKQLMQKKEKTLPGQKKYPTVKRAFKVVGVFHTPKPNPDEERQRFNFFVNGYSDVIMPQGLAEEFFFERPIRQEQGAGSLVITVDHEDHLKPVCDRLKAEGFEHFAIGIFFQQARMNALLIGFIMDFVALIALTVAAIGITNTQFTSVLERTKDIGIMKAVGARDRTILLMFLFEGALIGLIGGVLGMALAYAISIPANGAAMEIVHKQEPNLSKVTSIYVFPWWLLVGAPVLAVVLTTIASYLPARRAARIEPVVALRSE